MVTRSHYRSRFAVGLSSVGRAASAWGVAVLIVFLSTPASLEAKELSGSWKASALRVSWSIGDWGKACGPRPGGGGQGGGVVTLTPEGRGFQLNGLGRSYGTSQCWERMPGLLPKSHSAGASLIRTTCGMPSGDPRQATVVTSWYPRKDELYFDETGQYQFIVAGSNCTASVRRTRVLTRMAPTPPLEKLEDADIASRLRLSLDEEGARKESEATSRSGGRPPAPQRASRCKNPGKPARLEVQPKTKLMRAGESFQFLAITRDKLGCRVKVDTEWELLTKKGGKLEKDGTLTVFKETPTGALELEARVGEHAVKVLARVVSLKEFESLVADGSYGVMGESLETADVELSAGHVEFDSTALKAATKPARWRTWASFAFVLLFLLVGTILWFARRKRAGSKARLPLGEEVEALLQQEPSDVTASDHSGPGVFHDNAEARGTARLCPTCGTRYEDNTQFCVDDGTRLIRSN